MSKTHVPLLPEIHTALEPALFASELNVPTAHLYNPSVTLLH